MEPSNLFTQRRSYTKVENPEKREKSRDRNFKWRLENPEKKKLCNKNCREKNKDYYREYASKKHFEMYGVPLPEKNPVLSKLEKTWKNIIELEFPEFEFTKVRPDWLKNPVTKCNLELDLYCDELQLGIEINGDQHFRFTPKFYKSYDDFAYQLYKDKFKADRCKDLGIYLIIVTKDDKPSEIIQQIMSYIIKHETDRVLSAISQCRFELF